MKSAQIKRIILTLGFVVYVAPALEAQLQPVRFSDIHVDGELFVRAMKNYDRLESDIYTPDEVFPEQHEGVSADWPGDYEGRIILALTLQAQATHREPIFLKQLIDRIPLKVNEKGYLGPILQDSILEQQLSGHGWFLRGLCEYYSWKKDPKVKEHIDNIIEQLALPTRGDHKIYPIDPRMRVQNAGEASGTTQNALGRWKLSSDIGCDFIFMDGVIHAYKLFPRPEVKMLIDEMITRFLEIDLVAIKAQTHATLTALRGMLRYYEVTGESYLLREADERYKLYRTLAMTENYENYNWFERPEWTEPCGIVDAYMVATQLWQLTSNPLYLEDAHLIYYNALAHTQRDNGGFGLDNCVGSVASSLTVFADEAHWCCTMRGGEGMSRVIQYNYFSDNNNQLALPFFHSSEVTLTLDDGNVTIKQESAYPFEGKVDLTIVKSEVNKKIEVGLFAPAWAVNPAISINGRALSGKRNNGFISIKARLKSGDRISYSFDMLPEIQDTEHCGRGYYKFAYGPLLLGYDGTSEVSFEKLPAIVRKGEKFWATEDKSIPLTPVFHLLDPAVKKNRGYSKQILFKIGK